MKGIHLRSLTGELHHVSTEFATQPVLAVEDVESKLGFCSQYIESHFDTFSFNSDYHRLPLGAFRKFSFDEICKLKYSTSIMMDESVRKIFERLPNYEVVRKIMSSMWRWGMGRGTWNEVVDIWNGIRCFDLGLGPDFTVRLDYTTGYNEFGHSKYSRTYIDGVFAFLVYYKRTHVMTVGFSVTEGRRILIQQVQLKRQTGNRWLYRFPRNRMEFVIDLFAKHFPGFVLCVIDGKSLAKKTAADYEAGLSRAKERAERNRQRAESESGHSETHIQEDEVAVLKAKIAHLKSDSRRLAEFYLDCGRYVRGVPVVINRITHYQLGLQQI